VTLAKKSTETSNRPGGNAYVNEHSRVDAVPELSTWAMMVLSFAGKGPLTRRGRAKAASVHLIGIAT